MSLCTEVRDLHLEKEKLITACTSCSQKVDALEDTLSVLSNTQDLQYENEILVYIAASESITQLYRNTR